MDGRDGDVSAAADAAPTGGELDAALRAAGPSRVGPLGEATLRRLSRARKAQVRARRV